MSEITGVGFYESLNKFFVGFLILVLFVGLNSDLFINPLFLISAYIVGCIYQAIIQELTRSWLSLREDEIQNAYNAKYITKYEGENIKEDYLKAYYKIAKAGLLMNIPVLEALENFMRNLMFILPVYIGFFVGYELLILCKWTPFPMIEALQEIDCICIVLLSIFLMLVLLGAMWLRRYYQQTIYRLVWEGNKFLDKIDKDSKLEERKIRREMLKNRHFFFFRCKTRP